MTSPTAISPRKLRYPVAGDDEGGLLLLYGDPQASQACFLCCGFPDDHSVFAPLAQRLSNDDCFVGVTCLPGFDDDEDDRPWESRPRDGYTVPQVTQAIREAIKLFRQSGTNLQAKFTMILHDWGVVFGLMNANRALKSQAAAVQEEHEAKEARRDPLVPHQLVLLDVLLAPHRRTLHLPPPLDPGPLIPRLLQNSRRFTYPFVFAVSFFLFRHVSMWVGRFFYTNALRLMFLTGIFPLGLKDVHVEKQRVVRGDHALYMTYMYYQTLCSLVGGRSRDFVGAYLPLDMVTTPVLYLWGAQKKGHFHSPHDVVTIRQAGGKSQALEVKETGHWLFLQQADVCYEHIRGFLQS